MSSWGRIGQAKLELVMKRCIRSFQCGVGPARQTGPLPVENLTCTKWPEVALVQRGPMGCLNLVVLGCFHMRRKIEASCAHASHLVMDRTIRREGFLLPVSKTDPYTP
eukprot:3839742-Amphidinium_carterae.1